MEKMYQQCHQVIQKRNPFQLTVYKNVVITLSDICSIIVHSLLEKNGSAKYPGINRESLYNLYNMNFHILVNFQQVFFDSNYKIAIHILACAADFYQQNNKPDQNIVQIFQSLHGQVQSKKINSKNAMNWEYIHHNRTNFGLK
jgi:hypothetical protein